MFVDFHASVWWAAGLVAIGALVFAQKTKTFSKKRIPGNKRKLNFNVYFFNEPSPEVLWCEPIEI